MRGKTCIATTLAILLLSTLCYACAPMSPNSNTISDPMGPNNSFPDSPTSSQPTGTNKADPHSQTDESISDSTVLKTEFGGGTVEYEVTKIDLESSYADAGISEKDVISETPLGDDEVFLKIAFSLKNLDLNSDSLGGDYLVNNFALVDQVTLDKNEEGAYLNSPVYFDKSTDSGKRYFAYTLPEIGESSEIVLGWVLNPTEIEALKSNELYLCYTTMGLEDASILPLEYQETE